MQVIGYVHQQHLEEADCEANDNLKLLTNITNNQNGIDNSKQYSDISWNCVEVYVQSKYFDVGCIFSNLCNSCLYS